VQPGELQRDISGSCLSAGLPARQIETADPECGTGDADGTEDARPDQGAA
jgi:hypothetical protein